MANYVGGHACGRTDGSLVSTLRPWQMGSPGGGEPGDDAAQCSSKVLAGTLLLPIGLGVILRSEACLLKVRHTWMANKAKGMSPGEH